MKRKRTKLWPLVHDLDLDGEEDPASARVPQGRDHHRVGEGERGQGGQRQRGTPQRSVDCTLGFLLAAVVVPVAVSSFVSAVSDGADGISISSDADADGSSASYSNCFFSPSSDV
jgi:hypothetical protein